MWNLYDVFADFLEINGLPTGPLILRDLEADDAKLIKSGHEHKLVKIERVLAICHRLPFVLIGDAGQDDPAIYREVARRNPGRVLAIYIRAVRLPERNNRARQIACEMGDAPPMLVFETVDEALGHAAAAELIGIPRRAVDSLAMAEFGFSGRLGLIVPAAGFRQSVVART